MVIAFVDGCVTRQVLEQAEALEEPGHVGEVPLRRAHLRHRLNDLVFGGEGFGQSLRGVPDAREPFRQRFDAGRRNLRQHRSHVVLIRAIRARVVRLAWSLAAQGWHVKTPQVAQYAP